MDSSKVKLAVAIAKAKIATKKKKEQEKELALIQKVISQLPQAPSIDEIASRVVVPTPKQEIIKEVHTKEIEVVKPLDRTEILQVVDEQFRKMAEMEENNNREILPEIKVIREEVDKSDLVTKKDLDEWLKKINNAILASKGGGGMAVSALNDFQLANVIEVAEDKVFKQRDFVKNKLNILHCTQPVTVKLPKLDPAYIVWVQQGFEGDGAVTILKEQA